MALTVSDEGARPTSIVTLNSVGFAEVGLVVREDQEGEGVVEQERKDEQRHVAHRLPPRGPTS